MKLALTVIVGLAVIAFALVWRKGPGRIVPEIRPASVVSMVPAEGDAFAEQPYEIVIDVNSDLTEGSEINLVSRYGDKLAHQVVAGAGMMVDSNRRTLRAPVNDRLEDGRYTVLYRICHSDGCRDGRFQFTLNRTYTAAFTDFRGQIIVLTHMKNSKFDKQYIIIDRGTKVTWVNDDAVSHSVVSDPEPTHSYAPDFASNYIDPGKSFSFTFTKSGEFPYHDQANASDMTGVVIVR